MEINKRDELQGQLVTSREVLEILNIKWARLSQLVKNGKLKPIKKSVFLLSDVLERKEAQEELRKKFYRPKI